MLVFPRRDLSSAEGTVGARARERVVGGSAYDPVALSVTGPTVDDSGRFVDGAAPREGHIDRGFRLGRREATAILVWRHSEVLYEEAPHRADVPEPGSGT